MDKHSLEWFLEQHSDLDLSNAADRKQLATALAEYYEVWSEPDFEVDCGNHDYLNR